MKILAYSLSILLIAYLGIAILAYYLAPKMVFPAPAASYTNLPGLEKLESTHGESIAMLYLPAQQKGPLLLYSHGNGEDLGHIYETLKSFQNRGIAVLAYDYPGYGISSGTASESGALAAADSVYCHATETLGYTPDQITLYGRSLGSGPSSWLAERYPIKGLIFEGAFTSTFRVMTFVKILPFDIFDNLPKLEASTCPVLLLHGKKDFIVPFRHAKINRTLLGERAQYLWVPEAGHNNVLEVAGPRYWETVLPFIQ